MFLPILIRQNAFNPHVETYEIYKKKYFLRQELLQKNIKKELRQILIYNNMIDIDELLFYQQKLNIQPQDHM